MENIFFDHWTSLGRTLIVGVLAYIILIAMLRIFGKRTLSELKEFDFLVSVALGSTLSTVILDKSIALTDGILAMAVLIGLQFAVAKLSVYSSRFRQLATSSPTLIFYQGRFLKKVMNEQRIVEDEIRAIIRKEGLHDLSSVSAVILEPNGQFSVVPTAGPNGYHSSLYNVKTFSKDG